MYDSIAKKQFALISIDRKLEERNIEIAIQNRELVIFNDKATVFTIFKSCSMITDLICGHLDAPGPEQR